MARQKSRAAKAESMPKPKKAATAKRKFKPRKKMARKFPMRKVTRSKPKNKIARKLPRQKVMRETFMLPAPAPREFESARIAPPEEPLSLSHPARAPAKPHAKKPEEPHALSHPARTAVKAHAKKDAIPAPLTAMAGAIAVTALLAAFLMLALGMNPLFTTGISMAVFVGFSIVFYTILETSA